MLVSKKVLNDTLHTLQFRQDLEPPHCCVSATCGAIFSLLEAFCFGY